MVSRSIFFVFIVLLVASFATMFHLVFVPIVGAETAVTQFDRGGTMTTTRVFEQFKFIIDFVCVGIVVVSGVLLFSGPLFSKLRKEYTA